MPSFRPLIFAELPLKSTNFVSAPSALPPLTETPSSVRVLVSAVSVNAAVLPLAIVSLPKASLLTSIVEMLSVTTRLPFSSTYMSPVEFFSPAVR